MRVEEGMPYRRPAHPNLHPHRGEGQVEWVERIRRRNYGQKQLAERTFPLADASLVGFLFGWRRFTEGGASACAGTRNLEGDWTQLIQAWRDRCEVRVRSTGLKRSSAGGCGFTPFSPGAPTAKNRSRSSSRSMS